MSLLGVDPLHIPGMTLLDEVGRGAQTVVYKARRKGRLFAVKVQRDGFGDAAVAFRREAAVLARLHHPSLAEIVEVGEVSGRPYLVMEYVDGRTLDQMLHHRKLPEYRAVAITLDLCAALVEVHRHGLVHRDIKPSNVLLDDTGRARLIDFGLAATTTRMADDTVVGTFLYSAPEQTGMLARPVDGRADLYALGALLFESLTGAPPFQADDIAELIRMHAVVAPPALGEGVSNALAAIVHKLLAKDPDDRYQTAQGLSQDLDNLPQLNAALAEGPAVLGLEDGPARASDLPLVGREREVTRLRECWASARVGQGGVLLVEGVSGSGKSRLLRELITLATEHDGLVLAAKCGESDPMPFGPIRAALEDQLWKLDRMTGDARQSMVDCLKRAAGDQAPLLARLSAELARVLEVEPSEDVSGHDALQDAAASFLLALSAEHGPTLLVIDDVQWLDASSRRVLTLLAQGARHHSFLVACTARSEIDYADAVHLVAADLQQWIMQRIQLGPLDEDAIARLVSTHLGGGQLDPTLSALIARRSQGSPFAAGEYIYAMLDAGLLRPSWGTWIVDSAGMETLQLPSDVLRLVLRRIDALGDQTRAVLTAAAVLGGRFTPLHLRGISSLDDAAVHQGLSDALSMRLVEPAEGGDYAFIHDRVREALLGAITEDERRTLHQRAAVTLEAGSDDDSTAIYAIAHHYSLGHLDQNPTRVYEACLAAGRRAMSEYAAEQAWVLLSLADQVAGKHDYERDPAMGNALGVTAAHTGRFDEAVHHLEQALDRTQAPLAVAQLHISLADLKLWAHVDTRGASRHIGAGLDALGAPFPRGWLPRLASATSYFLRGAWRALVGSAPASGDDHQVQRALSRLYVLTGGVAYFDMDNVQFLEVCARQYDVGTRLQACKERIDGQLVFSMLWAVAGLRGWAAANIKRAHQDAEDIGDRWSLGTTFLYKGFNLHQLGDALEAEHEVRNALEQHGNWLEMVDYLTGASDLAWNLFMRGYTTEALRVTRRATDRCARSAPDFRVSAVFIYAASLEAMLGRGQDASRLLAEASEAVRTFATGSYGSTEVLAHTIFVRQEEGLLGAELDRAIEAFEALHLSPMMVAFHLQAAYVFIAYGRVQQVRRAEGAERSERLTQLAAAVKQLAAGATVAVTKSHLQIARAWLAYLNNKDPSKHLRAARELAQQSDNAWVDHEAMVLEAEWLAAAGRTASATRMAQSAFRLAAERGWRDRYRALRDRFQLASMTRTAPSRTTGASEALRLRRHLDALLAVTLASASARGPIHQAQLALDEVVRLLGAERAFLFLTRDNGASLELRVARDAEGGELMLGTPFARSVVERVRVTSQAVVSSSAGASEVLASESVVTQGLRSILAAPMLIREQFIGVVYLDTRLARGVFTEDDVEVLTAIANQVAVTVERARLQEQIEREEADRQALERFHAPDVVKRLMMQRTDHDAGQGGLFLEPMDVTVLFCDLSGFTSFCDSHDAAAVARLMNAYLSRMTEITFAYNGTVDKYIGDAVMCIFGAPFQAEDDAQRAVQCAMDMRRALRHLVTSGATGPDTEHLDVHIGINTGPVVAGTIGSELRMEYTALGDTVNIASRLLNVAGLGQIVVGPETARQVNASVDLTSIGEVALKGKSKTLQAFRVDGSLLNDDLTEELEPE